MFSTKILKVLLAAAVAAMALSAVSVSSASATIVNAKFSTSLFKLTTSGVTIKKSSGATKSCTLSPAAEMYTEANGFFVGSNEAMQGLRFTCTDGTYLRMSFNGTAKFDTLTEHYYLQVADFGSQSLQGPWGFYFQSTGGTDRWTWVNGSGSTPSTMTLNEQYVGYMYSTGEKLTITGTITAKTSSGGLVTLSH